MTTGREELLPISIFACAEAMESIERFPLNPIEMEIDTAYHSRTFGVGYTGTAELEEEISLPIFKGARVAFIDALVTPGEYRVLVRNKGDKSEIINGHIYIY